jgi:hypothetical protein
VSATSYRKQLANSSQSQSKLGSLKDAFGSCLRARRSHLLQLKSFPLLVTSPPVTLGSVTRDLKVFTTLRSHGPRPGARGAQFRAPSKPKVCAVCGVGTTQKGGGCRRLSICSPACLAAAWPTHKWSCTSVKVLSAAPHSTPDVTCVGVCGWRGSANTYSAS